LQRFFRTLQTELDDTSLTTLKLVQTVYDHGLGLAFINAIIKSDENTLLVFKNTNNDIKFLLQRDKLILVATAKGIVVNFVSLSQCQQDQQRKYKRLQL